MQIDSSTRKVEETHRSKHSTRGANGVSPRVRFATFRGPSGIAQSEMTADYDDTDLRRDLK
eukprot:7463481-Pyramimonas_sp.AAC.1